MRARRLVAVGVLCSFAMALDGQHPLAIASISVCGPTGTGGSGTCPSGSFDTHQIVLGPDGTGSVNGSSLGVGPAPDEHSTVFPPGALGTNPDYLFFLASTEKNPGIGVAVLSGGSGPDKTGRWTLDYPKLDGYGLYSSGFGQVFNAAGPLESCPVIADGNPAHQDPTFDLNYAAPGSVVKDPTAAPGSLLMIYEGSNACIGSAGGTRPGSGAYISLAIATSLDFGKTWPTYRGTPTFNFVPLPDTNHTQGPNAPLGAMGANVCIGNNCSGTPPASYGRYAVLTPPTSITSLIAMGKPLTANIGEQEISGFVDDVAGAAKPYLYVTSGGGPRVARAQLNGGLSPLTFQKWTGKAFDAPGIGGADVNVLPDGPFENCEGTAQLQYGSSISYVEDTQQYLLIFVCDSPGDPALGKQAGAARGAAWFWSTSYDLSDQTQWTPPREVSGTWETFDNSGGCGDYKGHYPTFMTPNKSSGRLSLTGYAFYLWGCQQAGTPAPGRQFSSRAFTITTGPVAPIISKVANAEGEGATIAPNTWVEIKGSNLAPASDTRIWAGPDFVNNKMPTGLDGVSVTVNGKSAYVYYISPSQVNILTPPDALSGSAQVAVTNNGSTSAGVSVPAQALSPSLFVFNGGPYVAAEHANGALIGPTSLYPGSTTPAKPGETILIYANGFGPTNAPVISGSTSQSGTLSPLPLITIGGRSAAVQFAGLVAPGEFQFNVVVPLNTPDGDQPITAMIGGVTTSVATLLTVQR
jgi:uncharacterized protein (TIGR03437 family)